MDWFYLQFGFGFYDIHKKSFPRRRRRRDCLDPKSKAKPKQIESLECLHMKLAMKWNLLFLRRYDIVSSYLTSIDNFWAGGYAAHLDTQKIGRSSIRTGARVLMVTRG